MLKPSMSSSWSFCASPLPPLPVVPLVPALPPGPEAYYWLLMPLVFLSKAL
jgi:hypothetical protein